MFALCMAALAAGVGEAAVPHPSGIRAAGGPAPGSETAMIAIDRDAQRPGDREQPDGSPRPPRPELFPTADSVPWPEVPVISSRIRSTVAARWNVPPEQVVIAWGPVRAGTTPTAGASVEVLGSGGQGHWIVRVRDPGWEAPVQFRIRTGVAVPGLVAARRLPRNHVLTAADILVTPRIHWGAPGTEPADAVEPGMVVQRVLDFGEPLAPPAVKPPHLVVSGDPVEILWARRGVHLTVAGTALGSAPAGDPVYVRTEHGRRLRGVVLDDGRVRIDSQEERR